MAVKVSPVEVCSGNVCCDELRHGGQGKVGCVELWRGRASRGGSGTIRLGWVWFRAVRFDMAVKLGSGWAASGQAGRVTFRYGGFRQGGQGMVT